ncbi:hypothetical protein MMC16_007704 [Acarospora aff. strigata]|nr:hypothetical protein [Acarospora aff. strigata]
MEKNAQAAESKETLLSLQELDPSPVDDNESPTDVEKGDYFDRQRPRPIQRSSTLGLSGHSAIYWLSRLQKYSSYAFTTFLTLHITNTSLIPLLTHSLPASDTYLLLTRPYYQSPIAEPLLVALPLATHVASGIALRLYRRRQNGLRYGDEGRDRTSTGTSTSTSTREDRRKWWPPLSGTSALGYVLLPFALGHVFVNRVLPLRVEGGSSGVGLQYVAHGFARMPAVAGVGYAVFVGVGVWHVVWGWAKWMGWTPAQSVGQGRGGGAEGQLRRKRRWYVLNAGSAMVAALWLAGGLGVVGRGGEMRGWLGRGYDELYRRVPVVGRWI